MKKTRLIVSMMLAVVMVITMAVSVSAEKTGSITINETVDGRDYDLFKVFDLTYSSLDSSKVAYTIAEGWEAFFEGSDYIVDENPDDSLNEITVDGETKYMNITDENVAAFSIEAFAYAAENIAADASVVGNGGAVAVDGLALGYYIVYPRGATELKGENACICSLTSTNPDGAVTVKATYPTIDKEADITNGDVGDVVTYTITGKVPDTNGFKTYLYQISDTMTEGLTFNKDVVVTVGGQEVEVTPDYTVENGFDVAIDVITMSAGAEIEVSYTATINEKAIAVISENKAYLTYSNNPKDETSTEKTDATPEIVKVYTSKIVIDKVDGKDESIKLAGAKFALKKGDTYYSYANEDVEWIAYDGAPNETAMADLGITIVTTNEEGEAEFAGLADGEYELVEVVAPEGYNLLTKNEEVTVAGDTEEASVLTITTQVKNNSGTVLPTTGGMGTTMFYVIGAILVVGAVIVLVTRKRMSANQDN